MSIAPHDRTADLYSPLSSSETKYDLEELRSIDKHWPYYEDKQVKKLISHVNAFIMEVEELRRQNRLWGDQECENITSPKQCKNVEHVTRQCRFVKKTDSCQTAYGSNIESFFVLSDPDRKTFLNILRWKVTFFVTRLMWLMTFVAGSADRDALDKSILGGFSPADALRLRTPDQVAAVMRAVRKKYIFRSPSFQDAEQAAFNYQKEERMKRGEIGEKDMKTTLLTWLHRLASESRVHMVRASDAVQTYLLDVNTILQEYVSDPIHLTKPVPSHHVSLLKSVCKDAAIHAVKEVETMRREAEKRIESIVNNYVEGVKNGSLPASSAVYTQASNDLALYGLTTSIIKPMSLYDMRMEMRKTNNDPMCLVTFYHQRYPYKSFDLEPVLKRLIEYDFNVADHILLSGEYHDGDKLYFHFLTNPTGIRPMAEDRNSSSSNVRGVSTTIKNDDSYLDEYYSDSDYSSDDDYDDDSSDDHPFPTFHTN